MNSKANEILICLAFFAFQAASSQTVPAENAKSNHPNVPVGIGNNESTALSNSSASASFSAYYYLGEPGGIYLEEDYRYGRILMDDGSIMDPVLLRYNIYSQQMEFINEQGDTAAIGNRENIERITVGNRTFVYTDYHCDKTMKKGFMEVLADGQVQLLAYRCIRYVAMEDCADPTGTLPVEKYYQEKKYFYRKGNEPAKLLPEKRKDILTILPGEDDPMKSYLKETHNRLRSEGELVEAFAYCNRN